MTDSLTTQVLNRLNKQSQDQSAIDIWTKDETARLASDLLGNRAAYFTLCRKTLDNDFTAALDLIKHVLPDYCLERASVRESGGREQYRVTSSKNKHGNRWFEGPLGPAILTSIIVAIARRDVFRLGERA